MTPPYDVEDRRRVVTDDHVKLLVAEMVSTALRDQKHHLVSYIDKSVAASETKATDRHAVITEQLKRCETQCDAFAQSLHRIDSKLEKWINRGTGVWALAVTVFALVQFGSKWVK